MSTTAQFLDVFVDFDTLLSAVSRLQIPGQETGQNDFSIRFRFLEHHGNSTDSVGNIFRIITIGIVGTNMNNNHLCVQWNFTILTPP